jgi:hypothetical protein
MNRAERLERVRVMLVASIEGIDAELDEINGDRAGVTQREFEREAATLSTLSRHIGVTRVTKIDGKT